MQANSLSQLIGMAKTPDDFMRILDMLQRIQAKPLTANKGPILGQSPLQKYPLGYRGMQNANQGL